MSISRKSSFLLHRQLKRGLLAKPSVESYVKRWYSNQPYARGERLTTPTSALHANTGIGRLSSHCSRSWISLPASKAPREHKAGWKALSTQTNNVVDRHVWLIPRKGTGTRNYSINVQILQFLYCGPEISELGFYLDFLFSLYFAITFSKPFPHLRI